MYEEGRRPICRQIAVACHKEQRKRAAKSQKRTKDGTTRAKRIMKEVRLDKIQSLESVCQEARLAQSVEHGTLS